MAKSLDSSQVEGLRAQQRESCRAARNISLIITSFQEDAAAKATFFTIEAMLDLDDGTQMKTEGRFRYSQLFDFNEKLINEKYGLIRMLRVFPPKKFIGNKAGDFVAQRRDGLQAWLDELVADEEAAADPLILTFFNLLASK
jgi:hypothetical protein